MNRWDVQAHLLQSRMFVLHFCPPQVQVMYLCLQAFPIVGETDFPAQDGATYLSPYLLIFPLFLFFHHNFYFPFKLFYSGLQGLNNSHSQFISGCCCWQCFQKPQWHCSWWQTQEDARSENSLALSHCTQSAFFSTVDRILHSEALLRLSLQIIFWTKEKFLMCHLYQLKLFKICFLYSCNISSSTPIHSFDRQHFICMNRSKNCPF